MKNLKFVTKGEKILLKNGSKIIGYVNQGKNGYAYNIGKPSEVYVMTFTGKTPLTMEEAKERLKNAFIGL